MRAKALMGIGWGLAMMAAPLAAEDLGSAPGFEARSVTYLEGEDPQKATRVYMAPEGRRLEGVPPHGLVLVSPADAEKRWFVDEGNKRYAVDASVSKGGSLGSLLSHQPCKGFARSEKLGEVSLNGRDTVKWECRHPNYSKAVQWFDPGINTVIRDRTEQGKVQELRQIQVGSQNAEKFTFEPPEGYERVPIMQLFQR
ncbi:hypothetical protein [Thiohalorhabdus sp.]|uniref:hypothetical protein n=1 Tax=Thiohalorhabdus sp. TaxID=3094134 RepID=UPI002FC29AC0